MNYSEHLRLFSTVSPLLSFLSFFSSLSFFFQYSFFSFRLLYLQQEMGNNSSQAESHLPIFNSPSSNRIQRRGIDQLSLQDQSSQHLREQTAKPKILTALLQKKQCKFSNQDSNSTIPTFKELKDMQKPQETILDCQDRKPSKFYINYRKQSPKQYYRCIKFLLESQRSKIYLTEYNLTHGKDRNFRIMKLIKNDQNKVEKNQLYNKATNILKVVSGLNHPNIIKFYEVYEETKKTSLFMEFLQGDNFQSYRVRRKRYRMLIGNGLNYFDQIKAITRQILLGLSYLHQQKIAHLNISQKSIIFINDYKQAQRSKLDRLAVKIIGFGSAHYIKGQLDLLSPSYMKNRKKQSDICPPQVEASQSAGLKSDIWNLGITLFTIITSTSRTKIPCAINQRGEYMNMEEYIIKRWQQMQSQLKIKQYELLDLILCMVQSNYKRRYSAIQCLNHKFFMETNLLKVQRSLKQQIKQIFVNNIGTKEKGPGARYVQKLVFYKNIKAEQEYLLGVLFHVMDNDHDGYINTEDIYAFFSGDKQNGLYEVKEKEEELVDLGFKIIKRLGGDHFEIDFLDFSMIFNKKLCFINKAAILEVFLHLDQQGQGAITVHHLFQRIGGSNMSDLIQELDQIIDPKLNVIHKERFVSYFYQKLLFKSVKLAN